jgi:hypothetical protein
MFFSPRGSEIHLLLELDNPSHFFNFPTQQHTHNAEETET